MTKHKSKASKASPPSTSPTQRGLAAFRQKEYAAALRHWNRPELETEARVRQGRAEAHFRLALGLRRQPAECIGNLRRAVELAPEEARYSYHLGLALHRADELSEARAAYARAAALGLERPGFGYVRTLLELEIDPKLQLGALTWLAPEDRAALEPVAALLGGEPQAVLAALPTGWLERLKALGRANPPSELWRGLAQLALGDRAQARATLASKGSALRAGAESVRGFYHGLAAGQPETALADWTAIARAAAKSGLAVLPRLHRALVRSQYQKFFELHAAGQWESLLHEAQAAERLTPNEPPLLQMRLVAANRLAQAAAEAGDWERALAYWKPMWVLLESHPTLGPLGPVLRNIAIAHEAREQWGSAADAWAAFLHTLPKRQAKAKKKAQPEDPPSQAPGRSVGPSVDEQRAWLRHRLLDNYKRANRPDAAITYYRQLVKAAPEDLDLRLELASTLLANEQEIAARNEVGRILGRDPKHLGALILQAEIYQQRGERCAAEKALRAALEIDPSHETARRGLAQILKKQGNEWYDSHRNDRARELYLAALELVPADPELHVRLADIEFLGKKEAEARQHLDAALTGNTPEAYVLVFNFWMNHENEAEARQALAHAEAAGVATPRFYLDIGVTCLRQAAPPPTLPAFFGPRARPPKANAKREQFGRDLIQKGLVAEKNQAKALRGVIGLLVESGLTAYAAEYSRRLIALMPDDVETLIAVALLLATSQDTAGAKELLNKAEHLAWQQSKKDQLQKIKELRRAISNPLFGMMSSLLMNFGPEALDDLDDFEDEEFPFR